VRFGGPLFRFSSDFPVASVNALPASSLVRSCGTGGIGIPANFDSCNAAFPGKALINKFSWGHSLS
jgi:hypothetical protein